MDQNEKEENIEKIITSIALDNVHAMESALEEANNREIAQAIRYMSSDDREKVLSLLSPEDSSEVLANLYNMDEEETNTVELESVGEIPEVEIIEKNIDHEYIEYNWHNIIAPSKEELETLSEELDIPIDFLMSPLDIDERPRVEVDGRNMLILIRTPHFDESKDIQYITVPLGIIFSDNMILTISFIKNDVIQAFADGKLKGLSTVSRSRFLLQIFSGTARVYLDYLKRIDKQTSLIEKKLQKSMKNKELIEFLNIEKSLVYFATSLRANELVLDRLQRTGMLQMQADETDLLEDVIIEIRQAIEMTNIHSNILSALMDAFASIISNNLNAVMKFLTSVTIILMFPVWVSSVYGMNINLPFQHSPHAFAITMGFSIFLSVCGAILFWKRKWF
ncbi:MAG: CorA family divalent cation transporter [bacterium]